MDGALRTRAGVAARLVTIAVVAAALLAVFAGAASAAIYPVIYNGLIGYGGHALTPDVPAAGSIYVNWRSSAPAARCHSATHPHPVVLIDGTWANQADDFAAVAPLLADHGTASTRTISARRRARSSLKPAIFRGPRRNSPPS